MNWINCWARQAMGSMVCGSCLMGCIGDAPPVATKNDAGALGTGGSTAQGALTTSLGGSGYGNTTATGGQTPIAGAMAVGGGTATGGSASSASGGTPNVGGNSAVGGVSDGTRTTGGKPSSGVTGGTPSSGGALATSGGSHASGGAVATGGSAQTTGGSKASNSATTGGTATGGQGVGGAATGGAGTGGNAATGGASACVRFEDCARGYNCNHGNCAQATVSCIAQSAAFPGSADGVYWINPSGTPMIAYCDMQQRTELCTQVEAEHTSRTRDGSLISYTMTSVLDTATWQCSMYAVRDSVHNYPFAAYILSHTLDTCQAFGFLGDVPSFGSCQYGDTPPGNSNCGFPVTAFYRWADMCDGCDTVGNGSYDVFTQMGIIHTSDVLSDFGGSIRTRCKVR